MESNFDSAGYESRLRAALKAGKYINMRETLASEKNFAAASCMPTLGTFDSQFISDEAATMARVERERMAAEAKAGILEKIMQEQGDSTALFECGSCGKYRTSSRCSMCEMPDEY